MFSLGQYPWNPQGWASFQPYQTLEQYPFNSPNYYNYGPFQTRSPVSRPASMAPPRYAQHAPPQQRYPQAKRQYSAPKSRLPKGGPQRGSSVAPVYPVVSTNFYKKGKLPFSSPHQPANPQQAKRKNQIPTRSKPSPQIAYIAQQA